MNEEEYGDETASDVSQESVLDTEPIVEETVELEEDVEEVVSKAEYDKLKEIAENQRIRAEKAEKKAKVETPKAKEADLSPKDLYAFMEAKIPRDDIEDVIEYSKLKGIAITEALQSNVVKAILADKAEQRAIAEATNTGTARRGTAKLSDEVIIANAAQGKLPDDPADLVRAQIAAMKNK